MVAIKVSALLALLPLLAMADEAPGFTMDQNPGKLVPKIPSGSKDEACIKAYKERHIECVPEIMHLVTLGDPNEVPTEVQLEEVCTSTCLASLRRWIRGSSDCGPEKFLKFLKLSNSTTTDAGYKTTDLQQFFLNGVYWDKCLVDLVKPQNGGSKWCVLQWEEIIAAETSHPPDLFSVSDPDDFCKDQTCGAQFAYLSAPKKYIRKLDDKKGLKAGEEPKIKLITLKEACPKIDTSKFPKREEKVTASDLGEPVAEAKKAETDDTSTSEKSTSESSTSTGAKPEASVNGAQVKIFQARFAVSALLVAVGALIL
ncbi:uncharacterized protein DFL_008349 [Arthrobotrys flagrans]|uniref:Uncharacterized protein n=1 Tax=Arthrobotrys flagrans TaxID=97331 RepID=A0A436ZNS2_ARTFL|nr:hypothetical protein DFL_008349 [Arthrobotrys flagrans]